MNYYVLFVNEALYGNEWVINFGDYSRERVQEEREDMMHGAGNHRSKDLRIINTKSDMQDDIMAHLDVLNGH